MEGNINKITTDFIIWFDESISNGDLKKVEPQKFWFAIDGNYYPIEEIFELYNSYRKN